jgi:hypothetical protein
MYFGQIANIKVQACFVGTRSASAIFFSLARDENKITPPDSYFSSLNQLLDILISRQL